MKILIVSQYFFPENFKVNDIAFDFVENGHEVTVLTGKPNYPNGKFYEGYNFFSKRKETINGVNVIRVPLFPRLNGSGKYLALNYLSFLFFSFFAVLFRLKGNYDLIFSHLPSPLTSAIPAIWLKRKFKAPLVLWVLDLWPESVKANSKFKDGWVIKNLSKIVRYIYKNSDKILVSSNSFKEDIIQKFNISEDKIEYFPNWAEDVFTVSNSENVVRQKIPKLPEGFNVVFAGNIGESQDFESVLKSAELTINDINWVLIGDGRKADWIKEEIRKRNITNVYLLGRFPLDTMPLFFKKADVMLVSLKDEPTFAMTIPAKVQAYMASNKIILGMFNGEGKELINYSKSGFAVGAGDYKALAKKAIYIKSLSNQERSEIERNSLNYYKTNFSKNVLFQYLEKTFKTVEIE